MRQMVPSASLWLPSPLCPCLCSSFGPARARKPKHRAIAPKTSPHDVDKPVDKPESHTAQSAFFHGSNRASHFQLAALSSATRTLLPSPIAFSNRPPSEEVVFGIDRSRLVSQAQHMISLGLKDAVRLPCDLQRSRPRRVLNQPTAAIKHTEERSA
ncbi:uncharacterized protein K441DRAFT_360063 [Cenococcum geophilum 1.58]|uniref:Uncharacterized protein n=1 Tax=Cenococcum geophilum 1.58 TaxID=794803 RepID=A0ACC8ELK9_9PEZI|nr:hypothetical protein K441DRAFT_360063 [Cenococcum geophilum 1.58]